LGLTFEVELLLLAHLFNATFTLNKTIAHNYICHTKIMEDKKYGLKILVANLTNLIAIYL
jgi:hypothetical protein